MKKQFLSNFRKNRYFYMLLGVTTVVAVVIVTTTEEKNANDFITGFFFFAAFLWMAAFIFTISAVLNYANSVRLTKRSIEYYAENAPESFLSYDDEKLLYITGTEKAEYQWQDITGYMEHEDSIYFIIKNKLLESVSFAQSDIGEEHYQMLRSIAIARFS